MIKTDDMVKVLAEEILKLEEKLVYKAEINMRKLNELVNRLRNNSKNVPDVGLTNCKIEFSTSSVRGGIFGTRNHSDEKPGRCTVILSITKIIPQRICCKTSGIFN